MTRYEIARMAREAGLAIDTSDRMSTSRETHFWVEGCYFDIERFFKLAYEAGAKDEREACARVCEGRLQEGLNFEGCAAAIRARGQQRPEPTYPSDPIWREQKRLEMEAWARNKLARHGIPMPGEDNGRDPV